MLKKKRRLGCVTFLRHDDVAATHAPSSRVLLWRCGVVALWPYARSYYTVGPSNPQPSLLYFLLKARKTRKSRKDPLLLLSPQKSCFAADLYRRSIPHPPPTSHPTSFHYPMSVSLVRRVRLKVGAGAAKPGPAIGQALGPLGLNMADFCKQFNEVTKNYDKVRL